MTNPQNPDRWAPEDTPDRWAPGDTPDRWAPGDTPDRWAPGDIPDRWAPGETPESGDIITSWLVQMLLVLAVISLIVYEVLAIGITSVGADDNAREVARAARDAYREGGSLVAAETAATEVAELHGAELVRVEEEGDELVVTLEKQARTLLVHRIGPLEDLATASATNRIDVQP